MKISIYIGVVILLLAALAMIIRLEDNNKTRVRPVGVLDEKTEAAICTMINGIYKSSLEAARKAREVEDFSTIGWSERCDLFRHLDYLIDVHGKVFKDRTILKELEISDEELTELIVWLASKLYPENYNEEGQQILLLKEGSPVQMADSLLFFFPLC